MVAEQGTLRQQAGQLAQEQRWDETARSINERLIELDPDDVVAHTRLARCYREQGDFEAAQGLYRRVLELAPDSRIAQNGLAGIDESLRGRQIGASLQADPGKRRSTQKGNAGAQFNRRVYDELVTTARAGKVITYWDLGHACNVNHHVGLHRDLGTIADHCLGRNEPILSALVVNQAQYMPSRGFFQKVTEQGIYIGSNNENEERRWWQAYCRVIWDHWRKERG